MLLSLIWIDSLLIVMCHDDHDARDTRNENGISDVLLLDNLFDITEPNDTKASELATEQRADASLSSAFEFAKLNKGGYFVKRAYSFIGPKFLIILLSK